MTNLHYAKQTFFQNFQHVTIEVVPEQKAVWLYFNVQPRPCFTLTLLKELDEFQTTLRNYQGRLPYNGELIDIDYSITYSNPSVFSFGGDLNFFLECIESGDKDRLRRYAEHCINAVYYNYVSCEFDLTTITLARGSALGGGFEAALSANVLVAERGTEFGLPETLFNLFPGMGAYHFLTQRLSPMMAEKMMLSGHLYEAEKLYEMGIVDVLSEQGCGKAVVNDYIRTNSKRKQSIDAVRKVRRLVNPIDRQQLIDVGDIWVDLAFNVSAKDMRLMRRLVSAQDKFSIAEDEPTPKMAQAL